MDTSSWYNLPFNPISGSSLVNRSIAAVIFVLSLACGAMAQKYTLGVGVYPGDPAENFAPFHIQWNAYTDSIEVVNYSVPNGSGLTATMEILNLDGAVKMKRIARLSVPEDAMVPVFAVGHPKGLSSVYFISLELRRGSRIISRNFYWRGLVKDSSREGGDMEAVRTVPKIRFAATTNMSHREGRWYMKTTLVNRTKYPALLVKLKVVGSRDGKRILPAICSDNFITIMPGDRRTIDIQVRNADTRGEKPEVMVEGFNLK